MNRKTFEFYKMDIEDGTEIDWESIAYKDNVEIPVLLGRITEIHIKVAM